MPDPTAEPIENSFERVPPAHPHPGQENSTGMGGADDGNSGAGNASGTPDAETAMSPGGEAALKGEVDRDRKALFP